MGRRTFVLLWPLALIFVIVHTAAATAQTACPSASCTFLPFISTSAPVTIATLRERGTRANTYRITGEILNVSSQAVYSVTLALRLYDAHDHVLLSTTTTTALIATFPGQLNPFDVATNILSTSIARREFGISAWSIVSPQAYIPLTVVSINRNVESSPWVVVSGEIQNDHAQPVSDVRIAVWLLDQEGGFGSEILVPTLAPGATVEYTRSLYAGTYQPPGPMVNVVAQGIAQP